MRTRTLASAAIALVCVALGQGATPAWAQNYDGSGVVRFGVFGQGTWVGADVRETALVVPPPPGECLDCSGSTNISGLGLGFSAGLDWRLHGNWMWGLEADWVYVGSSSIYGANRYTVDWTASARGRLGYHVHPGWLIYGTTGIAALGIEADAPAVRDTATTRFGWTIGLGTEVDWHHVTLFGEYLYADLDSWRYDTGTTRYNVDTDNHLLRFGVKFKVGHHHYHDDVRYPRR